MASVAPLSQTLSRGIALLEVMAEADGPLTVADLASRLAVHRSIAYRLVRTLEEHRLVARTESGAYRLAAGLAVLARGVSRDLQTAALPELGALATALGMTAFVAVLDGDEVVTLTSVEPGGVHAAVAQRPGSRHPVDRGAPGLAIQIALLRRGSASSLARRAEVEEALRRGFAASQGEVIAGLSSIAVPLEVPDQPPAALAVVHLTGSTPGQDVPAMLLAAARRITDAVG